MKGIKHEAVLQVLTDRLIQKHTNDNDHITLETNRVFFWIIKSIIERMESKNVERYNRFDIEITNYTDSFVTLKEGTHKLT